MRRRALPGGSETLPYLKLGLLHAPVGHNGLHLSASPQNDFRNRTHNERPKTLSLGAVARAPPDGR